MLFFLVRVDLFVLVRDTFLFQGYPAALNVRAELQLGL
jgi:hypothetical protein